MTQVVQNPWVPDYEDRSGDSLISDDTNESLYTAAICETRYSNSSVNVQLPRAVDPTQQQKQQKQQHSNADTCGVYNLGLSVGKMERFVDAERVGKPPVIPEPMTSWKSKDGSIKGELIGSEMTVHPPHPSPDQRQLVYRIEGHYTYALNRPLSASDKISLGVLPFVSVDDKYSKITISEVYDDNNAFGSDASTGSKN